MDSVVSVNSLSGKESKQKCIIPCTLFKNTNLTIGDYVSIRTSERNYVCRVFSSELYNSIYVGDAVTFLNLDSCSKKRQFEFTHVPNDLTPIKPSNFDHIKLKIILNNEQTIDYCNKSLYEDIVYNILKGYVVRKKCVVKCTGRKLAEFAHIKYIEVSDAFPETLEFGRLLRSSKIEVINVILEEQLNQVEKFKCIQLGGIDSFMCTLESFLRGSASRKLIYGPPGCGKSSSVKKFCCSVDCFFVVDGMTTEDAVKNKCNMIYKHCHSYKKIFPNHVCVVFIDELDIIAPCRSIGRSSVIATLFNMIKELEDLHVKIIAAATHKNNITRELSCLFYKKINLGMPSLQQKKEIVKAITVSSECNIDCDKIAQITPGFVGRDLALLIKGAINSKAKDSEKTDLECLTTDVEKDICSISPSILKTSVWHMKVKPVYWDDIGGMFHIKQRLQMYIEWPLLKPEVFKTVDLPCPRGVLLFGPPGCCKTTLAKGLATECNANFFAATPAQIYSLYVGESEKNITELFYQARQSAPSIVFFDEIDSLVSQRKLDKKSQGIGEKVLSALLNEMDGFGTKVEFHELLNSPEALRELTEKGDIVDQCFNDDVIVVAATNRPDLIDDALLRPGRFDVLIYVPPPNEEERESILHTLTKHKPVGNINMKSIAEKAKFFSGADLKNLCNEAAMIALRQDIQGVHTKCIQEEHFHEALKKIHPSITKQQIEMYEKISCKYGTFIKQC